MTQVFSDRSLVRLKRLRSPKTFCAYPSTLSDTVFLVKRFWRQCLTINLILIILAKNSISVAPLRSWFVLILISEEVLHLVHVSKSCIIIGLIHQDSGGILREKFLALAIFVRIQSVRIPGAQLRVQGCILVAERLIQDQVNTDLIGFFNFRNWSPLTFWERLVEYQRRIGLCGGYEMLLLGDLFLPQGLPLHLNLLNRHHMSHRYLAGPAHHVELGFP